MTFDSTRTYQAALDVRDWQRWRSKLQGEPEGCLWVLIGPRRSGKTWALKALESRDAVYVNLQQAPNGLNLEHRSSCLLIDEPGALLVQERLAFVTRCADLKRSGVRVLFAMTPKEWQFLTELDPEERHVKARDCLTLPLLSDAQASRIARVDWARALLPVLPSDWRNNPFLLELLLETAENAEELRDDLETLLSRTIHESARRRFRYVLEVFDSGLSEEQRRIIRTIARGETQDIQSPLLQECGLIGPGPRISDPILADHFRQPLVIHHISDVHFGPKSAVGVDGKEKGAHGKAMANAVGGESVREDYLHLLSNRRASGPHVVLVSGDLVETGTSDQYEAARAFLDQVANLVGDHPDLRPDEPRIAIVGGNHDVDWGETRGAAGARKRHLSFARYMDGYPRPLLEESPEHRSLSVVAWPGVGVEVALLGSAEFGGEVDETQEQLVRLVDDLAKRAREAFEAHELERFDALSKRLSMLDPGIVDHRDLRRLESHAWTQPVRIAMLHHPVSPMPVGTEVAKFGGLVNAGAVKTSLLRAGVSLVLHGHQHSGWFGRESWPGRYNDRVLHIAAAPTLGSRETIACLGFNEIRIFREGANYYEVEIQRIGYNGNGWDGTKDVVSFIVC